MKCKRRSSINLIAVLIFIVLILWISHQSFYSCHSNQRKKMAKVKTEALVNFNSKNPKANEQNYTTLNSSYLKYPYKLEPAICTQQILAILLITSNVNNTKLRQHHRLAISQRELAAMQLRRIFLLAQSASFSLEQQAQLRNEDDVNKDLLQGNFIESFRNLSYKHLMGLRWAALNCDSAYFIVKLDDDIVYDVFHLRHYLEEFLKTNNDDALNDYLLIGTIYYNVKPKREKDWKYVVTNAEYTEQLFPTYMSGWLYITNPATCARLIAAATQAPFLYIDDAWITGIVRALLEIPLLSINNWTTFSDSPLKCCAIEAVQQNLLCGKYVGPNGGRIESIEEFTKNMQWCYQNGCSERNDSQQTELMNKIC